MKRFLNWFRNVGCNRPSQRPRPRKETFQPGLEALETREMPAIVFQPQFGPEVRVTQNPNGTPYINGPVLSNTSVHLIFEGSYWQQPSGINITDALRLANNVLNSTYLSGINQYGSNGKAFLALFDYDNSMPYIQQYPGPGHYFYDEDIQATAQQFMSGPSAQPFARGVYFVVTAPGDSSLNQPDAGAYHGETATLGRTPEQRPFGWLGITGKSLSEQQDSFSDHFSHELVEAMTDPYPDTQPGVLVYKGTKYDDGRNADEIGDFEPEGSRYRYRLANGAFVQAYWSVNDKAFLVPDGNNQTFTLTPHWSAAGNFLGTYSLTINGDQLANKNDTITIDTVLSASGADRVRVTLNGEVATFDPYEITGDTATSTPAITVNTGAGNDTVNVERLSHGTGLTINLGAGTDAVQFSPSAGQMDNVNNPVTIHGGSGTSTVTVIDGGTANQNSSTHDVVYTIVEGDLTRSDLVTDATGQYHFYTTDLLFDGISKVVVTGAASGTTFNVAALGLSTPLFLYGKAGDDSLVFDDRANANTYSTVYTVTSESITRVGTDFYHTRAGVRFLNQTATVNFDFIEEVFVNGGTSGNQFNVQSVGGKTLLDLNTGPGVNTVQIGDGWNSLDSILGNVGIIGNGTDTVILNDRPVQNLDWVFNNVTFTITDNQITRTNNVVTHFVDPFGEVWGTTTNQTTISYYAVGSILVEGGTSGNAFDVQSTHAGTDLSIDAGSGDDYITIGDIANNLDFLAGPVHVFGEAGVNRMTVYDRAASLDGFSTTGSTFTITSQSVSHSVDVTYVDRAGETATGTVAATVSYSNITALGVYGGAGDDHFVVAALPDAPLTLDGGGGVNTLDYSAYSGDVVVNLPLGMATGFVSIGHIQNVTGSIGNDVLVGDANPNVLVGGTGRNLIIGGAGADLIAGGGDDNILIPGTTAYDTDPAALQAIVQEWTRTDLSFDDRVNELSSGAFADLLTQDTVFADLGDDMLVRGPGQNWLAPAALTTISVQSSSAIAGYGDAVTLTATVAGINPEPATRALTRAVRVID